MAERGRVQKDRPAPQKRTDDTAVEPKAQDTTAIEETDALLDEIDDLLDEVIGEQTAEEFVSSYVQRNGE